MKKITFLFAWIVLCLACNNGPASGTNNTNMTDSSTGSNAAQPTPGLGNDPTRNDTRQGDPIGRRESADSATRKGEADATPGVGNDPTRNDPSNTYARPDENTGGKKDSTNKGN